MKLSSVGSKGKSIKKYNNLHTFNVRFTWLYQLHGSSRCWKDYKQVRINNYLLDPLKFKCGVTLVKVKDSRVNVSKTFNCIDSGLSFMKIDQDSATRMPNILPQRNTTPVGDYIYLMQYRRWVIVAACSIR